MLCCATGCFGNGKIGPGPYFPCHLWSLKKKILGSWDGFLIPYPFSKGVFIWGNPIWVPNDTKGDVFEVKQKELEASLLDLTHQADSFFGSKNGFNKSKNHSPINPSSSPQSPQMK